MIIVLMTFTGGVSAAGIPWLHRGTSKKAEPWRARSIPHEMGITLLLQGNRNTGLPLQYRE